jgi:hypothetical protein
MSDAGLRVLITNHTLGERAGSELYVRDLALGLLRRGHRPVVYSRVLGDVAAVLRDMTVPVVDSLDHLGCVPDVIHGQHHLEAMSAVLRFPQVPAVYFCHGWQPWEETPPVFPSIRRYVAVDDLCAERLLTTPGIDAQRVRTIYNGVDLQRFRPRTPLPERPRSALIFSNNATPGGYALAIRAACKRHGVERVDVAGRESAQVAAAPESLLGDYDLVFAKARCALEAMATGCAVVVADLAGLGGLVTTQNMHALRRLNFGARTMQAGRITEEAVLEQLQRYDAADAMQVAAWIRTDAAFDSAVDRVVEVYREALAEAPLPLPAGAALAAASDYLQLLSPRLKSVAQLQRDAHTAQLERVRAEAEREQALRAAEAQREQALRTAEAGREQASRAEAERDAQRLREAQLDDLRQQLMAREREADALRQELHTMRTSKGWRAVLAYRRLRGFPP